MKNLKFFAVILTMAFLGSIGLSSCSDDVAPVEPARQGEVDVVMTTSLPQGLQTYANSVNSAESGLKNLEGKNLAVRYIMEVYPKGSEERVVRMIKYVDITEGGSYRTTSFQTRLLASEYNFVFWADIVQKVTTIPYNLSLAGLTTPYYVNHYFMSNTDEASDVLYRPVRADEFVEGDLKVITPAISTLTTIRNITPEMYDAYTCTKPVDLRTEPTTQNFTLIRPFAKLRLITTDIDKYNGLNPDWTKSYVTVSGNNSNLHNQFNALTGATSDNGSGMAILNTQALSSGEYSAESSSETDRTLYVFYMLPPKNSVNLNFSITVSDESGKDLATNLPLAVENVPLVANKLTTIKGNLLSKNATVNVTIDDEFEDPETVIGVNKEAGTVSDLTSTLSGGNEKITYTGKVTKEKGFTLNFDEVQSTTRSTGSLLYPNGNEAQLAISFADVEENAVITFIGENAPKTLRITTSTKCSLRINLPNSDVNYDGAEYQYIVTNSGFAGKKDSVKYFALFGAGNADRFLPSDYTNSHQFKINADFSIPENLRCVFASKHENKSCEFLTELQNWFNSNSGKTVWDFVGEDKL